MFVFPLNLYARDLNPKVIVFGDGDFGRCPGLNEVIRVGPWYNGISASIRRDTRELALFLFTTWRYRKKAAVSKPGGEPSPETNQAGTLILDSRALEM